MERSSNRLYGMCVRIRHHVVNTSFFLNKYSTPCKLNTTWKLTIPKRDSQRREIAIAFCSVATS
jgi:hypothetical protein